VTPYEKFIKVVEENQYFDQHQTVLIAVSGGLDSMTLFDWLYSARDRLNVTLSVAHVNHKQRAVSDNEEKALGQKMSELGIPFFMADYTGVFSEEKARRFRYDFFEQIMVTQGITALVTAHHKDDLIENYLIRQIRGSRLRYMTNMQAVQVFGKHEQGLALIRPLLSFEKSEFDASDYFEDASNAENHYLRNRVRNIYLPAFEKENPRFSENLASLIDEIEKAMALVDDRVSNFKITEKVELLAFSQESKPMQHFILQAYIARFPFLEVSKAQFDQLLHIIRRDGQYFHEISTEYSFIKESDYFYIEEVAEETTFETAFVPFDDGDFEAIDLPPQGQVVVRKRQSGDRIQVNGIEKKLRRYFIDNKIALKRRNNPLIVVDDVVYGVLGVVTADLSKLLKHDRMKRTLYYREKR
jgi:tRNA(Ile)-lysidine synthase